MRARPALLREVFERMDTLMKKIYGAGALSVMPCQRSFIFTAQSPDQPGDVAEGRAVVSFKQYSFDDGQVSLVTKNVFLMNKFGVDFEYYAKTLSDYINCKAVSVVGGLMIVNFDGSASVFDRSHAQKWAGSLKYKGFAPADVVSQGDFIWCSYPESNAVIKYNVHSMQQTFRVGGGSSGGIIEPCGLWMADNELIITSLGSGAISALDLENFCIEQRWDAGEPVLQYCKIDSNEIILTRSGIYRL